MLTLWTPSPTYPRRFLSSYLEGEDHTSDASRLDTGRDIEKTPGGRANDKMIAQGPDFLEKSLKECFSRQKSFGGGNILLSPCYGSY